MSGINQLEFFLEVATCLSYTQAAKRLNITGPALSKQISNLEDRLGVRLLNRTTRKVTLTDEGLFLFNNAKQSIDDLNKTMDSLREMKIIPSGRLKVSLPASFGLQYLKKPLVKFAEEYPELLVESYFEDRFVDIIGERYDVALRIGVLRDDNSIVRKVADCSRVVCCSPTYAVKYGMPNTPEDLHYHKILSYSGLIYPIDWRFLNQKGVTVSVIVEASFISNSAEVQTEALLTGQGIAMIPIFAVARHLNEGSLIKVLPKFTPSPTSTIFFIFPQNRHISAKVRLFVDFMIKSLNPLPWN